MKKLFKIAAIALPIIGVASTGIAVASTISSSAKVTQTTKGPGFQEAAYYIPFVVSVPVCHTAIVGFDIFGDPIFGTVCN